MTSRSDIHVRQLEVGDFTFIQELAAKQANFTVPPAYVLWLLLRIKDAICLVAEHSSDGPLAYLLSVPIETPAKSIYVWQLAANQAGQQKNAVVELLKEWRRIALKMRFQTIVYSTTPGSPQQRLINRYAEAVFAATPTHLTSIPRFICDNESEYVLELGPSKRRIDHPSQTRRRIKNDD